MFLSPDSSGDIYSSERPSRDRATWVTIRLWVLALTSIAILSVFGVRLYYLTILRGPYFYELSENNFLFDRPVSAPRGNILSADGSVIAQNRTTYDLEMSPFGAKKENIEKTVGRLADLLARPELKAKAAEVVNRRPKWKSVKLAQNLDLETVLPVLERAYELPGVIIENRYDREYPFGRLLGHLTGYVGAITKDQLVRMGDKGYLGGDLVGQLGSERQFETSLRGERGREILIRDARGRPRSRWIEEPAKRGNDVVLTIDLKLQREADRLMQGHKGAAIVLDPRDGAILALVSQPDYDPNFPAKIGKDGTSSYDKAIRGKFAPASTFKLVTAAAGLSMGRDPTDHISCGGNFRLPNVKRPFWCDVRWGHGPLDLPSAIQKSCNVFFFSWANEIGRDRLIEMAHTFGFGRPTECDLTLPGMESVGTVGMKDVSKIYQGSVIQMGIGQGSLIAVTPLQLVDAYAALANGGTIWRPHVFKEERDVQGRAARSYEPKALGKLPLKREQVNIIVEGLRRVVQAKGGTGFGAGFKKKWNVAGKTGSAELHGQKLTNGFFVGFAPMDDPKVAFVVLIEGEGHGGDTAAPIARDILATYFNDPIPPPPAKGAKKAEQETKAEKEPERESEKEESGD